MNITFNPKYVLKNDEGCVLLLPKKGLADEKGFDDSVNSVIHPFYAMMLSFVNGDEYDSVINNIHKELNIPYDKIKRFIDPLIENKKQVAFKYKETLLGFPINTILISNTKRFPAYSPADFEYNNVKIQTCRHKTPSTITLMLNNKCSTNCIYCYADKRKPTDCKIPLERIKELVNEAKKIKVISFDLIGGEVFLYKNWKQLLPIFYENGFEPFLSTKCPLSEEDVKFLHEIKIPCLQISLDTMIPMHLKDILRVGDNYIGKIKETFKLLEKYNIKVVVHSIVTNRNDYCKDMKSIFNFLQEFNNIRYWLPEIAYSSIYTGIDDYDNFKARRTNIIKLQKTIDECIAISKIKIINGLNKLKPIDNETIRQSYEERMESFLDRGLCAGNFSHMYILPTGDVTICEELYWHPKFIIGNVLEHGLCEIWNSDTAKKLYNLKQKDILEDSICCKCESYTECREENQICYRDTIKAYGEDKWYYPDPNCPKAPKHKNSMEI